MNLAPLTTDYLVIGAGASAMAFVDTLLSEDANATVAMVDREHRPGGHGITLTRVVSCVISHRPGMEWPRAARQRRARTRSD